MEKQKLLRHKEHSQLCSHYTVEGYVYKHDDTLHYYCLDRTAVPTFWTRIVHVLEIDWTYQDGGQKNRRQV